nr:hypothetical protein [Tanacetum cinerariifolium]
MSANDKFGLGDLADIPVNDRYADGMHAVPPPMTGNYMPSRPDVEIDYSRFTYGLKQNLADESDSKPSEYASCESDSSVETSTSMPELVENTPKGEMGILPLRPQQVVIRDINEILGTKSSTTTVDLSLEKVLKIH